jgi:hypothetical protein
MILARLKGSIVKGNSMQIDHNCSEVVIGKDGYFRPPDLWG